MPTEARAHFWQSLSARLVLAFMLLAGMALVVALVATRYAVEDAAEEKIRSDLTRTLESFQQLARSTQTRIRDVAEAHTRDRTFMDEALTANSDDTTLGLEKDDAEQEGIQSAHAVILSADTEVFGWSEQGERIWALFNVNKRLVFTRGDDEQVGDTVDLPVLDQALHQGSASALWSPAQLRALPFTFVPKERIRDTDLLLVYAHRAITFRKREEDEKRRPQSIDEESDERRRPRPIGVVLSGRWVSELLLENSVEQGPSGAVMRDARARFALLSGDGALATTLPASASVLGAPTFSATEPRKVHIGEDRYLVREDVFQGVDGKPIGRVFVLRDLDAEIEPILEGFRARLLPTAVGVMLLALALAVLLARHLSAPLVQLEAATRRVRLGSLDEEVPVRGADEVGRLAGAFNEMVAGLRQRDQIQGLFKRYLAPQVVDELIRNPEKAAPGGERRELSVLFIDLVGFTSLSEELSPEQMVGLLNDYFERATEVLGLHGATLDKFIGDAIMCFWNAPLPQEDHAARACLTALGLLSVVDVLAPEFRARGVKQLDCRIGVNTGPGVVGNLGSRAAQDYTVIGDTVNLASRLEGAARVYGTRTLVSEGTVVAARGAVLARELDLLRVKGRQLPVRVYELVDVAGATPPAHLARFAEGLALYRARRFAEAREAFLTSPEDPPSRVFAARCETWMTQPPPEDWDGVFSLDTK
jgi:class 3 adenylate cyclase